VHDDLVDVRVGGAGDLPGQHVSRDIHQRVGQAGGGLLPAGTGVVASPGRGRVAVVRAVGVLQVPARRAQGLHHDRAAGGRQPRGHDQ
jgi:hypothetical protein